MRIFAVLGSAPLSRDRLSLKEINQQDVLISFFDFGKGFTHLADIDQQLLDKYNHERKNINQPVKTVMAAGSPSCVHFSSAMKYT